MAVPKGRVSKSKRDKRKAQSWKIATPNLVKCSKCGELMVPHQVCKACGAYNKKQSSKLTNSILIEGVFDRPFVIVKKDCFFC